MTLLPSHCLFRNPSNSVPKVTLVDYTDPTTFNRLLSGIASAFISTPISRAFITEIDNTPPPYPSPSFNKVRLLQHITPGITTSASQDAVLVESGDFSAIAVWETTTYKGVPFSAQFKNVGPLRQAWRDRVGHLKSIHIGTRVNDAGETVIKPHYHLSFLVRNPEVPHVPGAVRAVVQPFLDEAVKEGVPVWLEATYEHAVEVYEHFGFRTIEIVKIGVGTRNVEGWPEEGGSGARGWTMIYDPHLRGQQVES